MLWAAGEENWRKSWSSVKLQVGQTGTVSCANTDWVQLQQLCQKNGCGLHNCKNQQCHGFCGNARCYKSDKAGEKLVKCEFTSAHPSRWLQSWGEGLGWWEVSWEQGLAAGRMRNWKGNILLQVVMCCFKQKRMPAVNRSNELKLKQVGIRACTGKQISIGKGIKPPDLMAGGDWHFHQATNRSDKWWSEMIK